MGGRPYSCRPRTLLRDYRGVQGCPSLPAAGSALRAERVRCMCSSTAQVRARPCATGSGDDLTAVAPVLCCATTEVCKAVLPSRFGRRVREGSSHCRVSPPRVGGDTCFSLYRGGVRAANGPLDSHLRWALFLWYGTPASPTDNTGHRSRSSFSARSCWLRMPPFSRQPTGLAIFLSTTSVRTAFFEPCTEGTCARPHAFRRAADHAVARIAGSAAIAALRSAAPSFYPWGPRTIAALEKK